MKRWRRSWAAGRQRLLCCVGVLICWATLTTATVAAPPASVVVPRTTSTEAALDPGAVLEEQLRLSGAEHLDALYRRLDSGAREVVPRVTVRDLVFRPGTALKFDPGALVRGVLRYLFREVAANARLLAQLVVLAVLLALLQSLQGAFGAEGYGDLVFAACYLVLILIGVQCFREAAAFGRQAVADMVGVMEAVLPLMASFLVAGGAVTSAALLSPVVYAAVTGLSALFSSLVLPVLFFGVTLGLAAQFSERLPLTKLAGLARQLTVGLLGLCFACFLGITITQGVTAPVADGVALRTGKFLASTFVPVVGKMFSDSVEVVAGGGAVVRNAVGLFGGLLLLGYALFPVLKIVALVFVFKLTGVLVEPVSDRRVTQALAHLESSLTVLAVTVAAVGVMFFMGLTVLVSVGNAALALR